MVDRRSLLDTGKSAGESVAGTLKSAAGTLKSGGQSVAGTLKRGGKRAASGTKRVASATADRVQNRHDELTDDTVTDQERTRLDRAREEAQREARQEAQRKYREEYRENLYDEAYDMELQRLRRQRGRANRDGQDTRQPSTSAAGLGMFGGVQVQQQRESDRQADREQRQHQPVGSALFGMPQRQQSDGDGRDQSLGVGALFGMRGQRGDQESDNRPRGSLFGLQF